MTDQPTIGSDSNHAATSEGDASKSPPWPRWKIVLAYTLLSALAAGSIWFIDLKVHRLHDPPANSHITPAATP